MKQRIHSMAFGFALVVLTFGISDSVLAGSVQGARQAQVKSLKAHQNKGRKHKAPKRGAARDRIKRQRVKDERAKQLKARRLLLKLRQQYGQANQGKNVEIKPVFIVGKKKRVRRPRGAPRNLPFQVGETLHYRMTWMGIPVGEATFSVLKPTRFKGKSVWQFRMEAHTNAFADAVYKVRDEMVSWSSAKMRRSLHHTKKAREGNYHRDIVVRFDHRRRLATYRNTKKVFKPRKIYSDTWDPLGLVYGFRCRRFNKPGTFVMSVTDGLKTIRAQVRVIRREEVEIGGEAIDSWKVVPDMKDVGGVFKRSKDAKMEVWVSTDRRHIPLKMRSKVIVGSFTATLVSATGLRR